MIVTMIQTRFLLTGSRAYKGTVAMIMLLFALPVCVTGDAVSNTAAAVAFNIRNAAPPEISIQVGGGGKSISLVSFSVYGAEIGNGAPVASNKKIDISLVIRASAANPLTGYLTVDSSTPLDNGNGATIPASEISWTSSNGIIPSGRFTDTSSQPLASFTAPDSVDSRLTFSYANRKIYDAGTYNGQVIFTWSAP
jgi:hypothetical protein